MDALESAALAAMLPKNGGSSSAIVKAGSLPGDGEAPKKKLKGKRKKKKAVLPLIRLIDTTLRLSAQASVLRPPRFSYGYCCVAGQASPRSDRLLAVENWCGNNEHLLLACVEGLGSQGSVIANYICSAMPAMLLKVAKDHTKPATAAPERVINPLEENVLSRAHRMAKALFEEANAYAAENAAASGGPSVKKPKAKKAPKKTVPERLTAISKDAFKEMHRMVTGSQSGVGEEQGPREKDGLWEAIHLQMQSLPAAPFTACLYLFISTPFSLSLSLPLLPVQMASAAVPVSAWL